MDKIVLFEWNIVLMDFFIMGVFVFGMSLKGFSKFVKKMFFLFVFL